MCKRVFPSGRCSLKPGVRAQLRLCCAAGAFAGPFWLSISIRHFFYSIRPSFYSVNIFSASLVTVPDTGRTVRNEISMPYLHEACSLGGAVGNNQESKQGRMVPGGDEGHEGTDKRLRRKITVGGRR